MCNTYALSSCIYTHAMPVEDPSHVLSSSYTPMPCQLWTPPMSWIVLIHPEKLNLVIVVVNPARIYDLTPWKGLSWESVMNPARSYDLTALEKLNSIMLIVLQEDITSVHYRQADLVCSGRLCKKKRHHIWGYLKNKHNKRQELWDIFKKVGIHCIGNGIWRLYQRIDKWNIHDRIINQNELIYTHR